MSNLKQRRTTRRELVVDNYHGTQVADPYRWLEDDTAPEVQQWMQEQNSDFEDYIQGHNTRQHLTSRLTELWHYEKAGVPHFSGGFYYTWRNNGLQNQNVLYRSPNFSEVGELIFDPNMLSEDGTVAVMTSAFSPGGNYLAYSLSSSGSDWQTIKVLDLNTKQECADLLQHLKFSAISWLPDESGFFYTRYPAPKAELAVMAGKALNAMVYLHILGQPQQEDKLICKDDEHPEWVFSLSTYEDKKWAFLRVNPGTTLPINKLFFRPLTNLDAPWLPIAADFVAGGYDVIGVVDDVAYIKTQNDAPMGKILSVKLSESGCTNLQTVIPEMDEILKYATLANNQLLTSYLHHATERIKLYSLDGTFVREIELPSVGTITDISAKNSRNECFLQFSSFLYPSTVLRYDFATGQTSTIFTPKIDFQFNDYETKQVFCTSKDGTQVPLFITHRKGLKLDGNNPTVLYGYGGFNISTTPNFSISNLVWIEKGGVYVTACLRGGSEYGEKGHRAGMLESKQNVFDDFISAGEYLIREKYTSSSKLGICGRSNGGLLTGACLTQRPDLFGAVIVWVPVLDMLRFHHFTSGRYWVGEYGCAENPEQFGFMYKYSPLHNVKMNTVYPPTLIMTADTDDRVVPSQARKFAATLQAADGGENPILIRIEKAAGHGAGKPVGKLITEAADMYTFFMGNLCK